jgi:hypothetical protein
MIIELTSPQIVSIFGWFNLKPYISWDDVQNDPRMSFRTLRNTGLTSQQLYTLQSDAAAWRQHGSITLHDCLEMTQWPMHPINTLKADLADIMSMHWTHDQLIRLGVNLDDLLALGMTPALMCVIGMPLTAWRHLGLNRQHVGHMSDKDIQAVFCMSRIHLLFSIPADDSDANKSLLQQTSLDMVRPHMPVQHL